MSMLVDAVADKAGFFETADQVRYIWREGPHLERHVRAMGNGPYGAPYLRQEQPAVEGTHQRMGCARDDQRRHLRDGFARRADTTQESPHDGPTRSEVIPGEGRTAGAMIVDPDNLVVP